MTVEGIYVLWKREISKANREEKGKKIIKDIERKKKKERKKEKERKREGGRERKKK